MFKDPITDDGTKKSAKGWISVFRNEDGEYYMVDQQKDYQASCLEPVFLNGRLLRMQSISEIRELVQNDLMKELNNEKPS